MTINGSTASCRELGYRDGSEIDRLSATGRPEPQLHGLRFGTLAGEVEDTRYAGRGRAGEEASADLGKGAIRACLVRDPHVAVESLLIDRKRIARRNLHIYSGNCLRPINTHRRCRRGDRGAKSAVSICPYDLDAAVAVPLDERPRDIHPQVKMKIKKKSRTEELFIRSHRGGSARNRGQRAADKGIIQFIDPDFLNADVIGGEYDRRLIDARELIPRVIGA